MNDEFVKAIKHYASIMHISEKEAREDAESTIKMYMNDSNYSREFAEATWIEETLDTSAEELDTIAANAKANLPKTYNHSTIVDAFGKKRERVRKPNEDKRTIISNLASAVGEWDSFAQDVNIANVEREITFTANGINYSITLTAHRVSKEKK